MAKSKRRAKRVAAHGRKVTKGSRRCKKCGRPHSTSAHWSHATNTGAKSFRAKRGTGKRKAKRKAPKKARSFTRGGTTFGPIVRTPETKAYKAAKRARQRAIAASGAAGYAERSRLAGLVKPMTRKERSKRNKAAHAAKQHRVKPHRAKNPGRSPGTHAVRGHLAKLPRPKKARGRRGPTAAERRRGNAAFAAAMKQDIRPKNRKRLG